MSRIYLVRHGRAAADFGSHRDPGLDDIGRAQAEAMAEMMSRCLGSGRPIPLLTSPLRRTIETAAALERRWGVRARIEPRVAEIPSPSEDLAERARWLRGILPRSWPELGDALARWRAQVVEAIAALDADSVVVSHFVAINVAVGHATGDDRVTCFRPEYCSRTCIEVSAGRFRVIELGAQAATRVI